jgi:hypothetical protein
MGVKEGMLKYKLDGVATSRRGMMKWDKAHMSWVEMEANERL